MNMGVFHISLLPRTLKKLLATLPLPFIMLVGCTTVPKMATYHIDTSLHSPNQSSRVRLLVMHYTVATLPETLKKFMDQDENVSAHYVISDVPDQANQYKVYEMVPTNRSAWHAGISHWQGNNLLNADSIGIEIVNRGYGSTDQEPILLRRWHPYPSGQIEIVAELAKKIIAENRIKPTQIVGHSDIAPGRKLDPGPLFPWELLYRKYGIGAWPDDDTLAYYMQNAVYEGDIGALQQKLSQYGYAVQRTGQLDLQTTDAIIAFQLHFRPIKLDGSPGYDGVPDIETNARLDALLEKYFKQPRQLPTTFEGLEAQPDD
jgi:N-acetylmuramoyl-L-alanine amidase